MKYRLSCFTVVISLLAIILLSVNVNALRGSTSPVDDEKQSPTRSRGSFRFSQSPTTDGVSSFSTPTSGAISRRADSSSLRRSPGLGSSLESIPKAALVARKLTGRSHSAVSDPTESIKPEGSVLEDASKGKNTARRNTQSLKHEATTRGSGDRRYLPERPTRVRTQKSFSEPDLEAPKETGSRVIERRISHSRIEPGEDEKILAQTGPSVFSGSFQYARSRTGRKIQNPVLGTENENAKPDSRKWESPIENPNSGNIPRNFDATAPPQFLYTTSPDRESVRVDIPLSVPRSETIQATRIAPDHSEAPSESSTTRSRGRSRSRQSSSSDRQSIRPRSESSTVDAARGNERRGGSRFSGTETESVTAGRTGGSSSRGVESRSRNAASRSGASEASEASVGTHKSRAGRGRGRKTVEVRKIDTELEHSRSREREPERQSDVAETRSRPRNSGRSTSRDERRSSSHSGGKSSDLIDSRSRVETPSKATTTTPVATELGITTVAPEEAAKIAEPESTVSPEPDTVTTATTPTAEIFSKFESTTKILEMKSEARNSRGRTRGNTETSRSQWETDSGDRRSPRRRDSSTTEAGVSDRREFRGRGRSATDTSVAKRKESRTSNQRRRLIGSTLGEEFRAAKTAPSSSAPPEDAMVGSTEIPPRSIQADDAAVQKSTAMDESEIGSSTASTRPLADTNPRRRGMKRLNIRPKDAREELSTASSVKSTETLSQDGRTRGGRRGVAESVRGSEIGDGKKTLNEISEEDNYPADFKARLAQLKNSDSVVPPATKSAPRIRTLNFKKPSPFLSSTNSRFKLEKNKKVINPVANFEENELAVEQTSVSPSTTQPLPTRRSLFGKRPRPAPITERKFVANELSTTSESTNVETGVEGRPRFGQTRRIEKPVMITVSNKNSETLLTNYAPEKANGNFEIRATKQRLSFAKRRSAPTTENIIEIDTEVTGSTPAIATTLKPFRLNRNSVSKYVRASRIPQKGAKDANQLGKLTEKPFPVVNKVNEHSTDLPNDLRFDPEVTTSSPSGRYTRRKSDPKAFRKFEAVPKSSGAPETSVTAKREFRPRTATYRRHSEAPPAPADLLIPANSSERISIAITPKTPEFNSAFRSAVSLPSKNAKNVNVRISTNSSNGNDDAASLSTDGADSDSGIFGSSNGESGNGATNVFNPTRTVLLINRNASLLEQLRSTVAPLLSSLGLKSPIFAGSYRNTTSTGNSAIRVTPSGQPPRFSARYKGAELFVRRPNAYQPTVPSVVSSTTPLTPLKVFGVSSQLDVSSPGEPKVLTYYQALETASINDEQQTDVQQPTGVGQVDNDNDKDINDTNNTNNDMNTVPALVPRFSDTETSLNTSENTITTEPEITPNPVTTTAASLDIPSETTPNIAQDASPESTANSQTTAETVTESIQTTPTSSVPSDTAPPSLDISSTTLATDTSLMPTPASDSTVPLDVEGTSSPQDAEPFARLLDATTVSLSSTSSSIENLETTTSFASTVTQESSFESLQDITTPGSGNLLTTTTAVPDVQTTQIPETTAMPFVQVRMQLDADSSTPAVEAATVEAETTPGSLSFDPTTEIGGTVTPVASTPQTTPSIFARFLDSETPDVTTVASSTQEPTTPSSLEITALPGATEDASQVTNEPETEVVTQISPANSQTELSELNIAADTSTQPLGQSDTTTTTPTTTQNVRQRLEQGEESTGGGTESDMSGITTSTETFFTTPESGDSSPSTITGEPRFEKTEITTESSSPPTTVPSEEQFGIISSDTVSVTLEPSLAKIVEPSDTVTTEVVASETTTIMVGEGTNENTTSQTVIEMISVNSSQSRAAFVDNTASMELPETTTQTTQNTSPPETTTSFESLSDTTTELGTIPTTQNNPGAGLDSFDISQSARLVEMETTQDPTLTTNAILTTEITRESNGASTQNPGEIDGDGTTELTTTNLPTANEVTTDSMPETSTASEPTTPNPSPNLVTDTPTLLARLQDLTATTTATVTAQGTAGLDAQATTRPNETSENPESTPSSPITQSPATTPASQLSNEIFTTDTNIPESTTNTIPPDSNEPSTTVPSQINADRMATTEEIPATSTASVSVTEAPTTSTSAPETTSSSTMAATASPMPETTFGIDENLIFANPETTSISNDVTTEAVAARTDAMQQSTEINEPTTISSPVAIMTEANPVATTSSAETTTSASTTSPPPVATTVSQPSTTLRSSAAPEAVVIPDRINQGIPVNTPQQRGNLIPTTAFSFPSRFGASRLTPAPRFSSSSSTRAPLRDYHVYGIYPNKTIVRKRPEDNLIDGRNVNSPYVIFGIYPDGKLVRKFPNGTVIPDPPRNPVEVVFSLSTSTTTTNRPGPVFYNQANPGYNYNQITPNYNNRPVPSIFNQNTNRFDAANFGFTGNAIAGSTGGNSGLSSVGIANKKMSDVLLETQMGTNSNTASEISDLLTTSQNANTGGAAPTPSRGIQISQDRESDEASRSRETNGQRSSVYIGQEKFINYWSDSTPNTSPRVVSVRINSVATSSNVGPASAAGSSLPSFDILPGSQPVNPVTTAPGFPWNDPLDRIFGVTTNAPAVTASVATNTLPDTFGRTTILPRPINPFVEVFTPVSSSIDMTVTGSTAGTLGSFALTGSPTAPTPTTSTTAATTTAAPVPVTTATTTTTTTTPVTTTTVPPAPALTTTTTTTTVPTTLAPTTTTTTTPSPPEATIMTASALPSFESPPRSQVGIPQQEPFGNTFNDLALLNALLQPADSGGSTRKTLSQAEQYLADKILSLALGNAGPTRSPKAIQPSNSSPNLFDLSTGSKSQTKPIIIDLLPSSTTGKPSQTRTTAQFTWKPVPIVKTTPQPPTTTQRLAQATWKPIPIVQTTRKITMIPVTTSKSVETTQKPVQTTPEPTAPPTTTSTTPRPRPTTTAAPPNQGFAAGLLTALFGSNPFAPAPTPAPAPAPAATKKPAAATVKTVETVENRRPVSTTQKPVREITSPKLLATKDRLRIDDSGTTATTEKPVRNGITVLLNNPNPRVPTLPSSTFSPEEDARFLAALLNSGSRTGSVSSRKPSENISAADQALLRAILNNSNPPAPTGKSPTASPGGADEKFLAALLSSASQNRSPASQKSAPQPSAVDEALLKAILNNANPGALAIPTSTFSPEDDAKFLAAVLKSASQPGSGTSRKPTPGVSADDEAFLRAILSGQASLEPASPVAAGTSGGNDAALLAALLKAQGIGPSPPTMTTKRPVTTTWTPSSAYPPSIFDAIGNLGSQQAPRDDRMIANAGDDTVRSQVVGAAIGATKAFSRFLGQAITGAAQQFQSFVRNGTKYVSEAVAG